jgi:hypothetical protein
VIFQAQYGPRKCTHLFYRLPLSTVLDIPRMGSIWPTSKATEYILKLFSHGIQSKERSHWQGNWLILWLEAYIKSPRLASSIPIPAFLRSPPIPPFYNLLGLWQKMETNRLWKSRCSLQAINRAWSPTWIKLSWATNLEIGFVKSWGPWSVLHENMFTNILEVRSTK